MARDCLPAFERVFHSLIGLLFLEGIVPPGSVIDAGAFDGATACFLCRAAPERTVHAIEFLPQNVKLIRERYAGACQHLQIHHGGLGERELNVTIPRGTPMQRKGWQMDASWLRKHGRAPGETSGAKQRVGDTFTRVSRIDDLFAPTGPFAGEKLAFAHWDVEGSEMSVLRGARQTLRTDQPIFSVEVHVLQDPEYTAALVTEISALGYDAYMLDEICGSRIDCRNLLCFPRGRGNYAGTSRALDLAAAGGRLVALLNNATALIERVRRTDAHRLVVQRSLTSYGEAAEAFGQEATITRRVEL